MERTYVDFHREKQERLLCLAYFAIPHKQYFHKND